MSRPGLGDGVVLPGVVVDHTAVEQGAQPAAKLQSVSGEVVGTQLIDGDEDDESNGGGFRRSDGALIRQGQGEDAARKHARKCNACDEVFAAPFRCRGHGTKLRKHARGSAA